MGIGGRLILLLIAGVLGAHPRARAQNTLSIVPDLVTGGTNSMLPVGTNPYVPLNVLSINGYSGALSSNPIVFNTTSLAPNILSLNSVSNGLNQNVLVMNSSFNPTPNRISITNYTAQNPLLSNTLAYGALGGFAPQKFTPANVLRIDGFVTSTAGVTGAWNMAGTELDSLGFFGRDLVPATVVPATNLRSSVSGSANWNFLSQSQSAEQSIRAFRDLSYNPFTFNTLPGAQPPFQTVAVKPVENGLVSTRLLSNNYIYESQFNQLVKAFNEVKGQLGVGGLATPLGFYTQAESFLLEDFGARRGFGAAIRSEDAIKAQQLYVRAFYGLENDAVRKSFGMESAPVALFADARAQKFAHDQSRSIATELMARSVLIDAISSADGKSYYIDKRIEAAALNVTDMRTLINSGANLPARDAAALKAFYRNQQIPDAVVTNNDFALGLHNYVENILGSDSTTLGFYAPSSAVLLFDGESSIDYSYLGIKGEFVALPSNPSLATVLEEFQHSREGAALLHARQDRAVHNELNAFGNRIAGALRVNGWDQAGSYVNSTEMFAKASLVYRSEAQLTDTLSVLNAAAAGTSYERMQSLGMKALEKIPVGNRSIAHTMLSFSLHAADEYGGYRDNHPARAMAKLLADPAFRTTIDGYADAINRTLLTQKAGGNGFLPVWKERVRGYVRNRMDDWMPRAWANKPALSATHRARYKAMLKAGFFTHLNGLSDGGVIGDFKINGNTVEGWACAVGRDEPVIVSLYINEGASGAALNYRYLAAVTAVQPTAYDKTIRRRCGSKKGNHGFTYVLPLPAQLNHAGKSLYAVGMSTLALDPDNQGVGDGKPRARDTKTLALVPSKIPVIPPVSHEVDINEKRWVDAANPYQPTYDACHAVGMVTSGGASESNCASRAYPKKLKRQGLARDAAPRTPGSWRHFSSALSTRLKLVRNPVICSAPKDKLYVDEVEKRAAKDGNLKFLNPYVVTSYLCEYGAATHKKYREVMNERKSRPQTLGAFGVYRVNNSETDVRINGWACVKGLETSVPVDLYVVKDGRRVHLIRVLADRRHESAVKNKCGTRSAAHRFSLATNRSLLNEIKGRKVVAVAAGLEVGGRDNLELESLGVNIPTVIPFGEQAQDDPILATLPAAVRKLVGTAALFEVLKPVRVPNPELLVPLSGRFYPIAMPDTLSISGSACLSSKAAQVKLRLIAYQGSAIQNLADVAAQRGTGGCPSGSRYSFTFESMDPELLPLAGASIYAFTAD